MKGPAAFRHVDPPFWGGDGPRDLEGEGWAIRAGGGPARARSSDLFGGWATMGTKGQAPFFFSGFGRWWFLLPNLTVGIYDILPPLSRRVLATHGGKIFHRGEEAP